MPLPHFGPRTYFALPSSPYSIQVADFNRDAKPDLAVARGGSVSILLGLGNGTFASPTNFSVLATYLAAGDFNNDGNQDLATIHESSYSGAVLLGDGKGTFPAKTNSLSHFYPNGFAVGDFNGDGKLDYATRGSMNAVVAFGRGDGSFGSSTNYNLTNTPSVFCTGDLDANGRLDLVVSLGFPQQGNSNNVCVLLNKGDGTFAVSRYYTGSPGPSEWNLPLELADLNHDGSLDLVLLTPNARAVTTRLNDGSGALGPSQNYSLGFAPVSVAAADFNGDGNTDLIVSGGGYALFLLGLGDGTLTSGPLISVPSDAGRHDAAAVGDFNGDGMPDLAFISCELNNYAVVVMLNKTPPLLQLTRMPGYNQLSWLNTFGAGYTLEYATNLAKPVVWHPFPYPPVLLGNLKAVADWEDWDRKFYRLRKP